VIATSRSPHVPSSVSTANVVVMKSQDRHAAVRQPPDGVGGPNEVRVSEPRFTETVAISLGIVPLPSAERRKIDRYLDATRGALLFARQVILVEGIAEAMLLRTLAEHVVFPPGRDTDSSEGARNRQLREQFRAISVLPIAGVDFVPYFDHPSQRSGKPCRSSCGSDGR
jgi:putative ATP-dependent endonuclease of OLD family